MNHVVFAVDEEEEIGMLHPTHPQIFSFGVSLNALIFKRLLGGAEKKKRWKFVEKYLPFAIPDPWMVLFCESRSFVANGVLFSQSSDSPKAAPLFDSAAFKRSPSPILW
jgi:hypothetical protein